MKAEGHVTSGMIDLIERAGSFRSASGDDRTTVHEELTDG